MNEVSDKSFEVYVVSKKELPKQFGLAKLLQRKEIKSIMRIKYMGPCKVLIQFNSRMRQKKFLLIKNLIMRTGVLIGLIWHVVHMAL